MTEWIKCSDRLPPTGQDVLVFDDRGEIHSALWCRDTEERYAGGWEVCYYCGGRSKFNFNPNDNPYATRLVIAWMPLPSGPK